MSELNWEKMAGELTSAARELGISLRTLDPRDAAGARPGLVMLKGAAVLFLSPNLSPREKAELLAKALARQDTENIYLSPAARKLVNQARNHLSEEIPAHEKN